MRSPRSLPWPGPKPPAALDGVSVPFYAPLFAPAGSVLRDRRRPHRPAQLPGCLGRHSCAAGAGQPREPTWPAALGGFQGRALRKGDVLPTAMPGDTAAAWWKTIRRRKADRPLGDAAARSGCRLWRWEQDMQLPLLRAVPGPQWDAFARRGRRPLPTGIYRLTADCDRMACKLQGPAIQTVHGADILSDGIVEGSVQVGGQRPAHRYAGRPTRPPGGYAKIATVISADLPALAQLRPGQAVAFTLTDPTRAVAAARAQACLPAAGGRPAET